MPTHSRGRCQLSNVVYLCFIALRPGLSLNLRLLAMLSDCRALDVLCLLPSNARFTSMCSCVHFYVSSGEFNSGLIFAQEIILPTKPSLQPKLYIYMNDGVEDRVLCNPGNPQAFYTASDGFELFILLPSPPECWDTGLCYHACFLFAFF